MANKKITELTLASPSSSASVVGEDGGVAKRFPVSSFGGGGGIIDVTELPTENINANAIYRVPGSYSKAESVALYAGGDTPINLADEVPTTINIVDVLPETGNPVEGENGQELYYQCKDECVYGYIDTNMASAIGLSVGWHLYSSLAPMIFSDYTYYGTIHSLDEATDANGIYCFATGYESGNPEALYHYGSNGFTKIITASDFEFNATTGTLVLNL